jgi:hypothetical protein
MTTQGSGDMEWASRLMASLRRDEPAAPGAEAPKAGAEAAAEPPAKATAAGLLALDPAEASAPPPEPPAGLLSSLSPVATAPARPAIFESPLLVGLGGAGLASVPAPPPENEGPAATFAEASPLLASIRTQRAREAAMPAAAPEKPAPEAAKPAPAATPEEPAVATPGQPAPEAAEPAPVAAPERPAPGAAKLALVATPEKPAPEAAKPAPVTAPGKPAPEAAKPAPVATPDKATPKAAKPAVAAPDKPAPEAAKPAPATAPGKPAPEAAKPAPVATPDKATPEAARPTVAAPDKPASEAAKPAPEAAKPAPVATPEKAAPVAAPQAAKPVAAMTPAAVPAASSAQAESQAAATEEDPFGQASVSAAFTALTGSTTPPKGLEAFDWVALRHSLDAARGSWSALFLGGAAASPLPLRGALAARQRGLAPKLHVTEVNPERLARLRASLEAENLLGDGTRLRQTGLEADAARLPAQATLVQDLLDAAEAWDLVRIGQPGLAGTLLSLDTPLLSRKVRWLMLQPSSRMEEAEALTQLLRARWRLVGERAALLNTACPAIASRPGVQLWRGPLA